MAMDPETSRFPGFDFTHRAYGRSLMVHADCFHWLRQVPDNSIAAVVTDPPYGIREYEVEELPKGTTLRACLRDHGTGGLRRRMDGKPFLDVIPSERTPRRERHIANHPSLKPQSLMRQLVWSALPLGEGVVVDPFMGSGSTVAAAEAVGYRSVGVERHSDYYELAGEAVPGLHVLPINGPPSPSPYHNEQAQLELEAGVPVDPVVHHPGATAAVDAGCDRAPAVSHVGVHGSGVLSSSPERGLDRRNNSSLG